MMTHTANPARKRRLKRADPDLTLMAIWRSHKDGNTYLTDPQMQSVVAWLSEVSKSVRWYAR